MSTIQGLMDDLQSETGLTLEWHDDREQKDDEVMGGSTPDSITYRTVRWEEDFAVVTGFSFQVDGVTISGRLPQPVSVYAVDAETGELLDSDDDHVLTAIRKACGPINFGETKLAEAHHE